jgi:hypothetical protein
MKRLHALIEKPQFEWLEEFSEQNALSLAETVRRALAEFRYRQSKRDQAAESGSADTISTLDGPTLDEDSPAGLARRLKSLEHVVFREYRNRPPSEIPSADLYSFIPDYMKL